jgi:hypothetical protein
MYTRGSVVARVDVFRYSVTKTEKSNLAELCAIKFCVKLGEGATDTYQKILKTFGNDSV